jgi:8-oxo-dGTP pyrophosphatase MutT (NUDIX family)
MRVIKGERIGKDATLKVGCAAIVWDAARQKLLLTRRSDNGKWCLPGGAMESGESAAEAVVREVFEETGLHVRPIRLVGVYTSPDWIIEYRDSNRYQLVALSFEAEIIDGQPRLSDETSEVGFFTPEQAQAMDLVEHHPQRIADALANHPAAFVR